MAWIFASTVWMPLPMMPLEAEDAEFQAAVTAYEAQWTPPAAGSVIASGLYQEVGLEMLTPPPPAPLTREEHEALQNAPVTQATQATQAAEAQAVPEAEQVEQPEG